MTDDKRIIDRDLLIRIDERTQTIERQMQSFENDVKNTYIKQGEFQILKDRFQIVRTIVFGMVGIILTSVLGALIRLIIIQ
jgi:hypothetical protein